MKSLKEQCKARKRRQDAHFQNMTRIEGSMRAINDHLKRISTEANFSNLGDMQKIARDLEDMEILIGIKKESERFGA